MHPLATYTARVLLKLNTTIDIIPIDQQYKFTENSEERRNMETIDSTSVYVPPEPHPELKIESNEQAFTLRLLTMNCW